ncbi:HIT family protein [Ignavigranum ruoffiae]|uniref:Histidine triad (HIT) family protein n=1 Tax=Ignavigranum ruoffiae TaxID=89093 RepID=A0A1H9DYH1_9LACT|nr:HIT family protein [Ignavigranum ruoffiae]UPQ85268.1 HIT family protein [Ignavigranum ruoffiae]SEQ18511.1 histidine triad (HIT) family protein [Ignavigranum ruoffiae]
MEDCIFCKIIKGEIPAAKVYEDEWVFAFLDLSQVTPGHTLVIPKDHRQDIFDYEDDLAAEVFRRVPRIAKAIKEAFPEAQGMNIAMNNGPLAYQSVFHSHIHLLPRYSEEDGFAMTFTNNQDKYSQAEFKQRAEKIGQAIKLKEDGDEEI